MGGGRRLTPRDIRQPSLRATFLKVNDDVDNDEDDDDDKDGGPSSSDPLENDDAVPLTMSADDVNVSHHPLDYVSEGDSSGGTTRASFSFHAVDFSHHWSSIRTSMVTHASTASPHDMAANAAISVRDDFVNDLPPSLRQDYDNRDVVAPFRTNEIILGRMLGSGEFSHVYEISKFRPMDADGLGEMEIAARQRMKSRERYRDTTRCTYAVKHLRPTLLETYTDEQYVQAARDVALEAIFLNSLSDPNIIKLRGISFAGPGGFTQGEFYRFCDGGGGFPDGGLRNIPSSLLYPPVGLSISLCRCFPALFIDDPFNPRSFFLYLSLILRTEGILPHNRQA